MARCWGVGGGGGGTKHFFILTLNFKNIAGGGTCPPGLPCSAVPEFRKEF